MIAALFVATDGVYFGLEGVEPWDAVRDARRYAGPFLVVAHPPCERWGRYWSGGPSARERRILGDDDGCFASALASVRRCGGVLEHPEASHAWAANGLKKPPKSGGWVRADERGWTCCVEQGHYGHAARKATWLYAVDCILPELKWGPSPKGKRLEPGFHSREERERSSPEQRLIKRLSTRERIDTPLPFRDLLLEMVRGITPGMARNRTKDVKPEVAETSAQLAGEIEAAKLPTMRENQPEKKETPMRPGWDRIVETILVDDPWPVYEQLEADLRLGDRRTDRGSLLEQIDQAETNMRLAHRLYATSEVEQRRWKLENMLIHSAMYHQATAVLQQEKDDKKRSKQITDEDVTNMAVVLYPDEYQAQEVRKTKVEQMVQSMKNLVAAWTSRCFSLKALKEDLR